MYLNKGYHINKAIGTVLLLCCLNDCLFAQVGSYLNITRLTTENGLPSSTVYFIYHDSKGLLWICTDKGLAKYDGTGYQLFTMKDGLPDNEVFQVLEDRQGRLWLTAFTGPLCYIKNNKVFRFKNDTVHQYWNPHTSGVLARLDGKKNIAIMQFGARHIFLIDGDRATALAIDKQISDSFSVDAFEVQTGKEVIIYCTNKTLPQRAAYRCNYARDAPQFTRLDTFTYYRHSDYNGHSVYRKDDIRDITLGRFPEDIKLEKLKGLISTGQTLHLIHDNRYTWITGDKRIWVPIQSPSYIYGGKDNTCWVSTLGHGVYKICAMGHRVNSFGRPLQYYKPFDDITVYGYAGYAKVFRGNKATTIRYPKGAQIKHVSLLGKRLFMSFQNGEFAVVDWQAIMAGGTVQATISENGIFGGKNYTVSKDWILANAINHIKCYSFGDGTVKRVMASQSRINDITTAGSGNVYIVNEDCLKRFDVETGKAITSDTGILFKKCRVIGDYFVALNKDNELFGRKGETGRFGKIAAGLFEQIEYLSADALWIKSDNQQLVIRHKDGKLLFYRIPNHYIPADVVEVSLLDSTIVFATPFQRFESALDRFLDKDTPPVLWFNNASYGRQIFYSQQMECRYEPDGLLTIDLDNVAGDREKRVLMVQVNGNGWAQSGNYNKADIVLRPGHNTIELMAKNANGHASNFITLQVEAHVPLWKSTLFLVLLVALGAGLASYLVYRYRMRIKERKFQRKLEGIKAEFKYLNALMNPHFVFNSMNSIAYLVSKNENVAAEKYISVLAKLLRQNMENLTADFISLEAELKLVQNYFELEQLRFKTSIELAVSCSDATLLQEVMLPPLSIQPLVENSIKHGLANGALAGKINIKVYREPQHNAVVLQIADNGRGIAGTRAGSMALDMLQTRLAGLTLVTNKAYTYTMGNLVADGITKGCLMELRIQDM
jgi:hypothetical protein